MSVPGFLLELRDLLSCIIIGQVTKTSEVAWVGTGQLLFSFS